MFIKWLFIPSYLAFITGISLEELSLEDKLKNADINEKNGMEKELNIMLKEKST